jgi:hypothetical protein
MLLRASKKPLPMAAPAGLSPKNADCKKRKNFVNNHKLAAKHPHFWAVFSRPPPPPPKNPPQPIDNQRVGHGC